jgi:predicted permease
MHDVRLGIRALRRDPGFFLVLVGILALGVGAATAVFSAFDGLLLQPLPGIPRPTSLISLETVRKGTLHVSTSFPDYRDYREQNSAFESMAARISFWVLMDKGDESRRVTAELITGTYFSTLGLNASAGRLIEGAEADSTSAPAVAVISHALWRSNFGLDPHVVGKVVRINSQPFEVIGVAPKDFRGTYPHRRTDIYVPLGRVRQLIPHLSAGILENRASLWLSMFGRLKEGTTIRTAQSEFDVLSQKIRAANPVTNEGRTIQLVSGLGFDSDDRSTLRRFFVLLTGVVVLLLTIVCANAANLLLARGITRRREIAIRIALGATRVRLLRQLLAEGALVALLGGLGALAVAPVIFAAFGKLPRSFFGFDSMPTSIDGVVLAFTVGLAAACSLLFSIAPAVQARSVNVGHAMKDGGSGTGTLRSRLPKILIVVQVGVSVVLLVGAGLMIRSVRIALDLPSGYTANRVLLANVDLGLQAYSELDGEHFYQNLVSRLRQQAGVEAVSLAQTAPSSSFVSKISLFHPGEVPSLQDREGRLFDLGVRTDYNPVTPGYFETLSITRLRGRDFDDRDTADSPRVCILSQSLAQRLWPNQEAIGQQLEWPPDNGEVRHLQVVGVVADVQHRSPLDRAALMVYMPLAQEYDSRATILVRYRGSLAEAQRMLLRESAAIDRTLAVFSVRTLEEQAQDTLWQQRTAARLIGLFAGVAILLTAIGLYGLLSYVVARRNREFGVRMALGARRVQLAWLVVQQSSVLLFGGIGLGLLAASLLARLWNSLLVGVSSTDAITFASVALAALLIGATATLIPARRATRTEPMLCLRSE